MKALLLTVSLSLFFFAHAENISMTLLPGDYTLDETSGKTFIAMEGFHLSGDPGHPLLPWKTENLLLPPGARVESVTMTPLASATVDYQAELPVSQGFRIIPGIQESSIDRVNRELESFIPSISSRFYPAENAFISSAGFLGQYSSASVAWCPFSLNRETGELLFHTSMEVTVEYSIPQDRLPAGTVPGTEAEALFSNFHEFGDLYPPVTCDLDQEYNYLILTSEGILPAVEASGFINWKNQLGYTTRTITVTDSLITGQPGSDTAARIRNFLREYQPLWGIEYLLIVGDYQTVPMKVCYPDPDYHVYDPSNPGLVAPGTPTDAYYADLSLADSQSWDLDGDGFPGEFGQDAPDFMAELSVGRIPVDDTGRVTETLERTIAFEQDNGSWKNSVLHIGTILFFENQNYSGTPLVDGATLLDSMETGLMQGMNITHMSEQWGLQKSLFQWQPATEAAFSSYWRNGEYAVVNWSGHGWPNGAARTVWSWDDGDGVPESAGGEMESIYFINVATTQLENDHPSVMFAVSCDVGYPEPNQWGNAGIDLLTHPQWGSSVGVVSASRPAAVSSDWKNEPGGTEQICYDFNRYLLEQGNTTGDALYNGKYAAHSQYGWNYCYEYVNMYNFNLYGDPALLLSGYATGVEEDFGAPSLNLSVSGANPFSSGTFVTLELPAPSQVELTLFDVTGRALSTVSSGYLQSGVHEFQVAGTDGRGNRLPSGAYLVRAVTSNGTCTEKLLLLE